jgi:FkbM family methyltransferase
MFLLRYYETLASLACRIVRMLLKWNSLSCKLYNKSSRKPFLKKWLKKENNIAYFDFKGIRFPDISSSPEKMATLKMIFGDVLFIYYYFNDNYDKSIVDYVDQYMDEGPYGYIDNLFDVTIKENDTVIDAGAWIGDFSAYVAVKGAYAYAFEPVDENYQLLKETIILNNAVETIIPIQKGLSDNEGEINIYLDKENSGGNSLLAVENLDNPSQKIQITTLDKFVVDNKLERVDFIKADIEGMERNMLNGAAMVLRTFAPKLAICTYHLPDDPVVLKKIILEANPNYKIVQLKHKLFAAVI